MFWSVVAAGALLSFIGIDFEVPEELRIPDFVTKVVGGMPSLYSIRLVFGDDPQLWNDWLQMIADTNPPTFLFPIRTDRIPNCDLLHSSPTECITRSPTTCQRNDQRCAATWSRRVGNRSVYCFDSAGSQLDCRTNGYSVESIMHSADSALIRMNPLSEGILRIPVEKIPTCEKFAVRDDRRTLINIPFEDSRPLRLNSRTVVYFRKPNLDFSILDSLLSHLNTTAICDCNRCIQIDVQVQTNVETENTKIEYLQTSEGNQIVIQSESPNHQTDQPFGILNIQLGPQIVDNKTPLFWRRPGRFDCPSEVKCYAELFYIFHQIDTSDFFFFIVQIVAILFVCICIVKHK